MNVEVLKMAVKFFKEVWGADVIIVMHGHFYNEKSSTDKKQLDEWRKDGMIRFTTEVKFLNDTVTTHDDNAIIAAAVETAGAVLSNDKFSDILKDGENNIAILLVLNY